MTARVGAPTNGTGTGTGIGPMLEAGADMIENESLGGPTILVRVGKELSEWLHDECALEEV